MTNYARRSNSGAESETPKKLPIMTAKEMRKKRREGEGWILPGTGDAVLLRRPGLRAMAANAGSVPNNQLSERAMKYIAKQGASTLLDTDDKTDEQRLKELTEETEVFYEILKHTFVSPKFVYDRPANEDANEVGPEDVGDYNITWIIYRYVQGAVEDIARFRIDTSDGDAGRSSETLQSSAQPDNQG